MSRLHRYSRSPSPYRSSEYSSRRNIDKRYNKSDSRDRDHKYDRTRDRDQSPEDYKRSKSKKFSKRSPNRHHYHSERRSTTSSKPSSTSDYKSKKSKRRKRSSSQDETRNRNYEEKYNKSTSSSSSSGSTESSAPSSSENSSSDTARSDRSTPRRNSINDGDDVVCIDSQSPQATNVQYHSLDFMDVPTKTEIFEEINNDEFSQKMFSSKSTLNNKVLIDLTLDTISVPKVESKKEEDTIFHTNLNGRDTTRLQKWIKKLFTYRQKTLCSGNT